MSNLLEKASILTTPTAYDDGKILSVKPIQTFGSELVTNGDFTDGVNDWTPNANATLTVDSGRLKVTISGGSGYPYQSITTEVGKLYKVTADGFIGTSSKLALYNSADAQFRNLYADGNFDFTFTATSTITQLRIYVYDDGAYGLWDNVSVKKVTEADFDFTRNSSATRVNSQGLVEDVGNNLPRIDYTGGVGHWLFEPQSTNLVYNSNSGFGSANMNLVYNDAISPDGTQNAYKSTTTTASGALVRTFGIAFAATSTFSVFLKYGNNQWYQIMSAGKIGNFVNVDIQNGVFGTNGADTENLSIKDFGNGWYRVSGTFINAAATSTLRIYTGSSSNHSWAATSAPIGSYNYGYGFQVEASSFATSYIPTNGSTVTRLQDAAFGAGSSDLINSTEGVLYAEIAYLSDTGTFRTISINDGSNDNIVAFENRPVSNQIKAFINVSGVSVMSSTQSLTNVKQFNKIAIKWKQDDFAWWVNGVQIYEDLSGSTFGSGVLNKLNFNNGLQNFPFEGKTKAVAVFKEALTDAELTCLTTI